MGRRLAAEFIGQLWLFWVAPIVGAVLAGFAYRWVGGAQPAPIQVRGEG